MRVSKVVIPAAGLGTRFLPFTKTIPKEMLPLINKPAIQHIVEEACAAGIEEFFIVTNKQKNAIEHHLSIVPELTAYLNKYKNNTALQKLAQILAQAHFTYLEQSVPRGLGHAIHCAQTEIGNEYFAVMLPDDLIFGATPELSHLIQLAQQAQASILAVQEVPRESVSSYGVIEIEEQITTDVFRVKSLIEKPSPEQAPSNLAIIGRYVLSPAIFSSLSKIAPSAGGEIQLTDGIAHMMNTTHEKVLAYKVRGERHDIGTPIGWLRAVVSVALSEPAYKKEIRSLVNQKEHVP